MKKRIAIITAAAMIAVAAAGCSGLFMSRVLAAENNMTEDGLHFLDDSNLGKSNLRIALLTSPAGTDDLAVNRGLKQGLSEFLESDKTASFKEFAEKTGKPDACLKMAEELAADYDVVVTSGEMFSGITDVAKKCKDTKFILFDAVPLDQKGNPVVLDNVTSFTYRDEESGFLAGIAAALESKSGKVAAVTAAGAASNDEKAGTAANAKSKTGSSPVNGADPGNVAANGKLGFACGVNYANKNLGTSVKVPVSDNEMTAKQLIAEGCDVLYPASPKCAKEVLRAAKAAKGVRVIGAFIDLFPYGGNAKDNVVITSVYRTQDSDLLAELLTIALENAVGENKESGTYDYSINYYFDTERSQLSDRTDTVLMEVFDMLWQKKVVPASLTNGMSADQFTGL